MRRRSLSGSAGRLEAGTVRSDQMPKIPQNARDKIHKTTGKFRIGDVLWVLSVLEAAQSTLENGLVWLSRADVYQKQAGKKHTP
jgi:hypothetical protein